MENETIKVYYEYLGTRLGVPYYHETLVYTKPDPAGGPDQIFIASAKPSINPAESVFSASAAAIDAVVGTSSDWGKLIVRAGPELSFFAPDVLKWMGTAANPNPNETLLSGADLSQQWQIIENTAQIITNNQQTYSPLTLNSNSAATTELVAAGITPPTDNGILSTHWATAADNILGSTYVTNNTDNSVTTHYADGSIVTTNIKGVKGSNYFTSKTFTFAGGLMTGYVTDYTDGSSDHGVAEGSKTGSRRWR